MRGGDELAEVKPGVAGVEGYLRKLSSGIRFRSKDVNAAEVFNRVLHLDDAARGERLA